MEKLSILDPGSSFSITLFLAAGSPVGKTCAWRPGTLALTFLDVAAKLPASRETFYSINHKNNVAGACSWISPANPIVRLSPRIKGTKTKKEEEEKRKWELKTQRPFPDHAGEREMSTRPLNRTTPVLRGLEWARTHLDCVLGVGQPPPCRFPFTDLAPSLTLGPHMLLVLGDLLFPAELRLLPPKYVLKSQLSVTQNVIYLEIKSSKR